MTIFTYNKNVFWFRIIKNYEEHWSLGASMHRFCDYYNAGLHFGKYQLFFELDFEP